MDIMDLLAGAGNMPLPGLGGGQMPGMPAGVPIEDLSGQPPSLPLPPSMPISQAIAQRPQANSLADLLKLAGIGGGQQTQAIPIQALRMMLFQHLNQQPAKGPFTAIVNPIVAALTARQLAPYYQQQQEATLAKQRLDQVQSLAAAQSSLATAGYNQRRTEALQREQEWWDSLTPEQRQQIQDVKNKIAPSADATLRGDVTREGYGVRQDIAEKERGSREKVAGANIASRERVAGANIASREGIAGRRLTFDKEKQRDLQDWREERKSQFDYSEWNKDRRLETTEAGKNIRAEKTRVAQDERETRRLKAQHDRALDTMTYQGLLQAQRLNEVLNSRTDETAKINTDLRIYSNMLKDDPDGAQGFFNETIVPQYEALYGDTFDIGTPGMGAWMRSVLSPLTFGYVSPPSELYDRPDPSGTSKRPPIQPVPVPGRSSTTPPPTGAAPSSDPMGNLIDTGKGRKRPLGSVGAR